MKCKNCGAELQREYVFCSECGAKVETDAKAVVQCKECEKFFKKEFGVCPFCGYELPDDVVEQQVPYCEPEVVNEPAVEPTFKQPVVRPQEVAPRNEPYFGNYASTVASAESYKRGNVPQESFFSRHKTAVLAFSIVAIIAIVVVLIVSNSGYTCSMCGEKFSEGYTVWGNPVCKDCFWS